MASKDKTQEDFVKKMIAKLSNAEQLIANNRINAAKKFGWSKFDFWCGCDGKAYLTDLVGISPKGEFDFVPDLTGSLKEG